MICERCKKNPATTHIRRTVNGETHEEFLCSECAAKSGLNFDMGLNTLLNGFLGTQRSAEKTCPTCGTPISSIRSEGKMGCADCYKTFAPYLSESLRRIHGNVKHKGKIPGRMGKQLSEKRELEDLKKKLSDAIAAEEYEEAAKIRDRIRKMESNGKD